MIEAIPATRKHEHYFKDVSHLAEVDVYRVLELFHVTDPCLQHAIKKLLMPGNRGHKNKLTDLKEAYQSIARAIELESEDAS